MLNEKNCCLCPSSLPEKMIRRLRKDFIVIPLPPDHSVDLPVQCHPDMICSAIGGTVFFHESYAEAYPQLIREIGGISGCRIVLTHGKRSESYPEDIALNAAVLPGALICRTAYTSPELISEAEKSGRSVIAVKQGYAACSCIVSGEAVLTTDRGIFRALTERGMDCTCISSDGIALPGYGCGFIGGCGGVFGDTLYLFGSDEFLRDRNMLRYFTETHGLRVVCLSDDPLTDHGGLKFL